MLIISFIKEADCSSQMKSSDVRHLEKKVMKPENQKNLSAVSKPPFLPRVPRHRFSSSLVLAFHALIARMCCTKILRVGAGLLVCSSKGEDDEEFKVMWPTHNRSSRSLMGSVSQWKHGITESKENTDRDLSQTSCSNMISVRSTWDYSLEMWSLVVCLSNKQSNMNKFMFCELNITSHRIKAIRVMSFLMS